MEENLLWSRFCASLGSSLIELPLKGVGKADQKSALLVRSPISNKNVSQLRFLGRSYDWQYSLLKMATYQNGHLSFRSI